MWFWGALLGLFAGAAMHGWSGAFWGAVIGTLAGLLLARQGTSAKSSELEKNLAQTQKALADIHWRLARLEKDAALPPSPLVQAAMAAAQPVMAASAAQAAAPPAQAEGTVATALEPVPPPVPVEGAEESCLVMTSCRLSDIPS